MDPKTKKILLGVLGGVIVIAIIIGAWFLGRSSSDEDGNTATTRTETTTGTVTVAPEPEPEPEPEPTPPPEPEPGPYSSMGAAVSMVEAQGMRVLDPGSTWHEGNTLHVIHGTPAESASYGGDFYYFFVDGLQVGEESFTSTSSDQTVDDVTFAVTFNVYLPTDPHCCPSGGISTVQFHWDGGSLQTIGSMEGANM